MILSAPEAAGYGFKARATRHVGKTPEQFRIKALNARKEEDELSSRVQDVSAGCEGANCPGDEGEKRLAKASAEDDLTDTTATRDADRKYLDNLVATCEQKAIDFESSQQLRAGEIATIEKAIEIISSNAVAGDLSAAAVG